MKRVVAAALAAFTTGVHLLAGGADVVAPMLAASMDAVVQATLYAVWHMVTVLLALSALLFWRGSPQVVTAMAALWLVSAVIFVGVGVTFFGAEGLLKLPQWSLLGPTGLVALWGRASV